MFDVQTGGDFRKILTIEKQIRFAGASTLTKLAGMSQDAADVALHANFHVRRAWWKHTNRFGIKIKKATRADLESAVYTAADWLLEAEGHAAGVKVPDKHAGHLAVPDVNETRHGIMKVVSKREKARYLLANPQQTRAFKVTTKSGYTLILQRKGGKGGRGGKKSKIVTKYIFRDRVKVPHHSVIVEPTIRTVNTQLGPVWDRELQHAWNTAKP
jgi:hypothetical protein